MFRSLIQRNAAVKLRIGFIVQNKAEKSPKLSSILRHGLLEYARFIQMKADIKVFTAEEALVRFTELDGLFISGKQHLLDKTLSVLPAERSDSLVTLLRQAVSHKVPVLSTSNGFAQMNNALLSDVTPICAKSTGFTPFFVKAVARKQTPMRGVEKSNSVVKNAMMVKLKTYGVLGRLFPGNHYQRIQLNDKQVIRTLSTQLVPEAFDDNDAIAAFSLASKESYYLAVNWKFDENKQRHLLHAPVLKSFVIACRKFNKNHK